MKYRIKLGRRASSYLRRCEEDKKRALGVLIDQIALNPYNPDLSIPMQGEFEGTRRARLGSLRILFLVDDEVHIVDVTDIGPPGDVYKGR